LEIILDLPFGFPINNIISLTFVSFYLFYCQYLIFDFVCLTLSLADTHGIAKYARTYIRDTHTQAHTQKKKTGKGKKRKKKREGDGVLMG